MSSIKKLRNCAGTDLVEGFEVQESQSLREIKSREIFQRHFEAQFKPLFCSLEAVKTTAHSLKSDLEKQNKEDYESDWDGFSDEETSNQIVEHTETEAQLIKIPKAELKSFMSSKPPKAVLSTRMAPNEALRDDDYSEAANIKNDIALHRFLSESHLLESAQNPTLSGSNRHKATDLRLQALGSRDSILRQQNMPMAHRKGIIAKKKEIELKRQKHALENGIVLEKNAMANKKSPGKRRCKGIGDPTIGRFTRGTLRLSKKDVKDIQGSSQKHARKFFKKDR